MESNGKFQVGDVVKWMSQSNSSYTMKMGTVIRVIKPGETPIQVYKQEINENICRRMFDGGTPPGFLYGEGTYQYLIALPLESIRAKKHKVYCPNPKLLKKVEDPCRVEENEIYYPALFRKEAPEAEGSEG